MENQKQKKHGWLLKTVIAVLIAGGIYVGLMGVFQPIWLDWHNYDTTRGFYEEPENTFQVVFFGPSHIINGITPTELYRDYGICAYNLGTEIQPIMASYYWLQECYRLHSESLNTVVLDVSTLRYDINEAMYWKAIDGMKYSSVKVDAVMEYCQGPYSDGEVADIFAHLNPLITYHSRWNELAETDFSSQSPELSTRGYNFETASLVRKDVIPDDFFQMINDPSEPPAELNDQAVYYYKKLVSFCIENNLQLVLMKTPCDEWDSADHNAVKALADADNVEFLDLNVEPYYGQLGFSMISDTMDQVHPNYYGAKKITQYMGEYLAKQCGITDVREQEKYQFMEDELATYEDVLAKKVLYLYCTSVDEYLDLMLQDNSNVIFITASDDASSSLTEEQRNAFASMGLEKLATIGFRQSYLAVIEDGVVTCEELSDDTEHADNSDIERGQLLDDEHMEDEIPLQLEGYLSDGTPYSLLSAGYYAGSDSLCKIKNKEYSFGDRGLKITVYNKKLSKVIDTTCFDTCASATRLIDDTDTELAQALAEGKTYDQLTYNSKLLYRYNYKASCIEKQRQLALELEPGDLLKFMDAYRDKNSVILISVQDEAANALTDAAREQLRSRGFSVLADIGERDSYLGAIDGTQVAFELTDHGAAPISTDGVWYQMTSGGYDSGNTCSIIVNGDEYAKQQRGINLVIYDKFLNEVVDSASFDTHEIALNY